MTTESSTTSSKNLNVTLALLVISMGLAIAATSLHLAGLGIMDEILSMTEAFELGRREGAQSAVLWGVSAGLGCAGFQGLMGKALEKMYSQSLAVTGIGAGVSMAAGSWLLGIGLAIVALVLFFLRRRPTVF